MSETVDKRLQDKQGLKEKEEEKKEIKWEAPFDIQRPNCIPGYGPYSISQFNDDDDDDDIRPSSPMDSLNEDIFDTKKSNTPSSSGDSGYGTTRAKSNNSNTSNKKVQDLFEALFAPVSSHTNTPPPSLKIQPSSTVSNSGNGGVNSKLSLLFSKKNDPHYVKYQTWSNHQLQHNQSTPLLKKVSSMRRPHEESLFKPTSDWSAIHESPLTNNTHPTELPLTIKVQKEHPLPPSPPRKQSRSRRRTDASLQRIPPEAIQTNIPAKPKHVRCKSIGSTLDAKALESKSPQDLKSPIMISPTDMSDILEHYDEKSTLLARYVSR